MIRMPHRWKRFCLSVLTILLLNSPLFAQGLSHVDVPVAIDLKPMYRFANGFVDTLFTSPNYPNGWVEEDCQTRYQYRFLRGPLQFSANNDQLRVSFVGRYSLRGSSRLCTGLGNSPWTPPCSCGEGSEAMRRVEAGFTTRLQILPDYRLKAIFQVSEPRAIDKCSICAFGIDVTAKVLASVKAELLTSLRETETKINTTSLRPYLQPLWDTLQAGYPVPGFGRLVMNPQALRISQLALRKDSLFVSIGLSAQPELSATAAAIRKPMPALSDFTYRGGMLIRLAQLLPYDSLNRVLNQQVAGQTITLGKGLLSKKITVDSARLTGSGQQVRIDMYTTKGLAGIFTLTGKPTYDSARSLLYFDNLQYEAQLDQKLLQNLSGLFDKTILAKLRDMTTIDLTEKTSSLRNSLTTIMNRQVYPGVQLRGWVKNLQLTELKATDQGIYVSGGLTGNLQVLASMEPFLSLK